MVVRGVAVKCQLIQLYFNPQRLEESHSANECGGEAWGVGGKPRFQLLIPAPKSPGYELFAS